MITIINSIILLKKINKIDIKFIDLINKNKIKKLENYPINKIYEKELKNCPTYFTLFVQLFRTLASINNPDDYKDQVYNNYISLFNVGLYILFDNKKQIWEDLEKSKYICNCAINTLINNYYEINSTRSNIVKIEICKKVFENATLSFVLDKDILKIRTLLEGYLDDKYYMGYNKNNAKKIWIDIAYGSTLTLCAHDLYHFNIYKKHVIKSIEILLSNDKKDYMDFYLTYKRFWKGFLELNKSKIVEVVLFYFIHEYPEMILAFVDYYLYDNIDLLCKNIKKMLKESMDLKRNSEFKNVILFNKNLTIKLLEQEYEPILSEINVSLIEQQNCNVYKIEGKIKKDCKINEKDFHYITNNTEIVIYRTNYGDKFRQTYLKSELNLLKICGISLEYMGYMTTIDLIENEFKKMINEFCHELTIYHYIK